MKKLFFGLTLATMCFSAVAGDHKISAYGRVDYTSADNDTKNTGNSNSEGFGFNRAVLVFKGPVSEGLKYSIAARITNDGNGKLKDGTSKMIESAYVTQTFSPMFDVTLGKQFIYFGSNEEDYNGSDVYLYSNVDDYAGYATGATFGTNFGGQRLLVQALNGDRSEGTQRKLMYGATYIGSFAGGMITPMASYHVNPLNTDSTNGIGSEAERTIAIVSSKFKFGATYLDLDYNIVEGTNTQSSTKDDKLTALVAKIGHKVDKCHFALKVISQKNEIDGAEEYSEMAYGAIYEHAMSDSFRYHAAYTTNEKDYKAASTKDTSVSKIILGLKFNVDIM